MSSRSMALDAAFAAGVLVLSLAILASGGVGTPDPATRDLDLAGAALATLAAAPLVLRRRAPAAVFLVTSLATGALLALRYPVDLPLAALAAVHALAVGYAGHPRAAVRAGAIAAVAALVPAFAAAYLAAGARPRVIPELLGLAVMVGGVWLLGDRTRLRQERLLALEERARRAELQAESERRLAAAEERTRIARELHDSAGHAINVILVQAGAARLLHERDAARSREAIVTIERVARETVGDIDRLVRALRDDEEALPPLPAEPAALEELLERHREGGLRVAARMSGEPDGALPRSVAWAAYRILQEALTNAARHGEGAAEVQVAFAADAVEITVENPAREGPLRAGGHGITGMRERAALLGGSVEAGALAGRFRLHARLPYRVAV